MKIFQPDIHYNKLNQLSILFKDYYSELKNNGVVLDLVNEGEKLWLEGLKKSLGKTSVLVLVENDGHLSGFAQGNLKLLPDYLGSLRIGVVSHFFVEENARGGSVAAEMYLEMQDWFMQKSVHSLELQVLNKNIVAEKFWLKMGFSHELLQMRKSFT